MKCLYHNDLDGMAAAFCVHAWVGLKPNGNRCIVVGPGNSDFIPMTYSNSIRNIKIEKDEQVWIVDFSIPPEDMDWLLSITKDVTWIDHHKTAIDKYEDYPHSINGIRKDGEAGCVLAYKYIHWYSNRGDPTDPAIWPNLEASRAPVYPVPRAIELIGDRDIWAFKHGDETRQFCMACECYDTSPSSDFWWKCLDRELVPMKGTGNAEAKTKGDAFWATLLYQGKALIAYRDSRAKRSLYSLGWETLIEGHRAICLNATLGGSELIGPDTLFDTYPILMRYEHNGREFTVSLYSKTVDVSEICKKLGGGGHKGAAGFRCVTLPYKPATSGEGA